MREQVLSRSLNRENGLFDQVDTRLMLITRLLLFYYLILLILFYTLYLLIQYNYMNYSKGFLLVLQINSLEPEITTFLRNVNYFM